jgi:hypothetical protein
MRMKQLFVLPRIFFAGVHSVTVQQSPAGKLYLADTAGQETTSDQRLVAGC